MMIKNGIIWLHKWLGIFSGLIVFILSITGCLYVFQDELKLFAYPDRYYIRDSVPMQSLRPITDLITTAQAALSDEEKISRVDLYPATNRTWVFRAAQVDEEAFGHWNYQKYYKRVFINPYSGKVQAIENTKYEFFQIVLQLHLNLLLGKKIGHPLVGISTLIFTILLLSGIVLWWPKNWRWKSLKKRLTLSFKVKRKRVIYDLHNVSGFYALLVALIFAVTGLAFAYPNFKSVYVSGFNALDSKVVKKSRPKLPTKIYTLNDALTYSLTAHPDADMMSLRLKSNGDKQDIQVRLQKDRTGDFVWYYFNFKDGSLENVKSDDTNQLGDQIGAMNYDLHVGNFWGFGTKIFYFFMSLICASLPVTGYIMWANKGKKKKTNRTARTIVQV